MISFLDLLALGFILLAAVALMVYRIQIKKNGRPVFRPLTAFDRLKKGIGLAVEDGSRIHVSLGKSSLTDPSNPSALVGLAVLEQIGHASSLSDRPPVATSGDAGVALLSQSALRAAYGSVNAPEQFDPQQGRLAGITPMSYIAGSLPVVLDEDVSVNILLGNFGPEAALLTEAAHHQGALSIAASDSLTAQAALYASAAEPVIGEELFAAPAYLEDHPAHTASLKTQDLLRWLLIVGMAGGAILKLLGVL